MPLEAAWSSPFQDCCEVCQDGCVRSVEEDWLADSLVACVCGIKGISGEALIFLLLFFGLGVFKRMFFVVEKFLSTSFQVLEAVTHAFKERKMLVLFFLVFHGMY